MSEHYHHYHSHDAEHQEKVIQRLNKIKGQVEGLIKKVNKNEHGECISLINQSKAVRGALKSLEELILKDHLNACLIESVKSGSNQETEQFIRELIEIYKRS